MKVRLTNDMIEAGRSRNGGWSTAQLRALGVNGFRPKWKRNLIGSEVDKEAYERFLSLRDVHLESEAAADWNFSTMDSDLVQYHADEAVRHMDESGDHVAIMERLLPGSLGEDARKLRGELMSVVVRLLAVTKKMHQRLESNT